MMVAESVKEEETFIAEEKHVVEKQNENIFKRIRKNVTMEPLWFGMASSMMIGIIANKNYYLLRACTVDLGYPEEVCLGKIVEGFNRSKIEMESQELVTSVNVSCGFIGGLITMLVVMFLGPWSDASGKRRPLVLYPIVGLLIGSFNLLMMQLFTNLSVKWVIYIHAIPIAMMGQYSLLTIAVYSYLGDLCVKEGRCIATVIGSNNGFFSFFMIFGTVMGPIIYRTMGFTSIFTICFILECITFVYAYNFVKDVNLPEEKIPKMYDVRLPLRAFQCVLKKREGTKRRSLYLIILVTCCNSMVYENDNAISYLYLRNKFAWTEVEYGMLLTIKSVLFIIGTLIMVTLFKRKLKMRSKWIGMIGGLSYVISYVGFIFSTESIHIFLVRLLSIFGSGVVIAERPLLLKQIPTNEQGKITCVTSVIDNFVAFLTAPLTNYIYMITLTWFPVCYIIISLIASLIQMTCYMFMNDPIEPKSDEEMKQLNTKKV